MIVCVCVCVHIHKSKEQNKRRGGGAAAASESLLLFHSPPTHALRRTNHPASSHPLCVIPATRTLPPSAATPASAHTQWWIRTRFCVVASLRLVSTVSMLSSSRSLPPPFDSFALTFYACYSFALPRLLLSCCAALSAASHLSSFLPLRLQVLCLLVPLFIVVIYASFLCGSHVFAAFFALTALSHSATLFALRSPAVKGSMQMLPPAHLHLFVLRSPLSLLAALPAFSLSDLEIATLLPSALSLSLSLPLLSDYFAVEQVCQSRKNRKTH